MINIKFNSNGFSLIELMVVIAIVAVLAAVAVPSYKNYILKSKTSAEIQKIAAKAKESIIYHERYGVFPNASQLGLAVSGNNSHGIGSDFSPSAWVFETYDFPDHCGNGGSHAWLWLGYDANALTGRTDIRNIHIVFLLINMGEYITTKCLFAYDNVSGNTGTDNIIPGCTNMNITTGWDQTELNTYFYDVVSARGCLN